MKRFVLLCLLCLPLLAYAANDTYPLPKAEQKRFQALTHELRCLVCQNQALADSDAPLAHDLRDTVYQKIRAGDDDETIKAFMKKRYGDFVLLKPPVQRNTWFLWLAPILLPLIGFAMLYNMRKTT